MAAVCCARRSRRAFARLPRTTRLFGTVLIAASAVLSPAPAAASSFTVDPTLIQLSPRASSSLLAVRNESEAPVTLQVSAYVWGQSPAGEMQLTPTDDIVFFPTLLTLQPGEQRKIRIGTTAPLGGTMERSYRVFVEELPPERRPGADATSVSVLTKMGIPVFLAPSTPRAQVGVRDVTASSGTFSFRLVNSGTVHLVPEMVRVTGTSDAGDAVFERTLQSWYVLAGGERAFTVTVPDPQCGRLRSLAVDVHVAGAAIKERLETPRGICAP